MICTSVTTNKVDLEIVTIAQRSLCWVRGFVVAAVKRQRVLRRGSRCSGCRSSVLPAGGFQCLILGTLLHTRKLAVSA